MAKPILYSVVDTLYHGVMDKMPKKLQDRSMASAFVLGFGGTYLVIRGLQWTSKNVMNKIIPNFDKKWLPNLEKACVVSMTAAPILYAAIHPKKAKAIMAQHPTYTSGMEGVYAGSINGAVQDLHKKAKQSIEDSL